MSGPPFLAYALLRPLVFAWARMTRGMTLGVQGLAVDAAGRVCLVRHSYRPGWHLPGGGVERGETAKGALLKEMKEEAGIIPLEPPVLVSVHSNERRFRGDHVLVFHLGRFELGERTAVQEIAEVAWFAPDALPEDMSPNARKRLAEALHGAPVSEDW